MKTESKNYGPISLLPLILKMIAKSTHDQTYNYHQRKELLSTYQSGFRRNHSAETCLSQLKDMKMENILV